MEQAEQCPRNIEAALTEAGCTPADVVQVRYLLPDRADFEPCRPTLKRAVGQVDGAADGSWTPALVGGAMRVTSCHVTSPR